MRVEIRERSKKIMVVLLSCIMLLSTGMPNIQVYAQGATGENLSLDNVRIRSFKITDVANGNKEIDYRTSDNAQYTTYSNDPSKFANAICENQSQSSLKMELDISYSSATPLKEGDKLTIPASLNVAANDFASKPLMDGTNHQLGTWEYKNGNFVISFSGDYIKNNRVTQFTASFETGQTAFYLSDKTTKLGERSAQFGKLGKETFVVAQEKKHIAAQKIDQYNSTIYKSAPNAGDSFAVWQISLASDRYSENINGKTYGFMNPHLLNNGTYSPKVLKNIYIEDNFTDVISAPSIASLHVWLSGTDDDGKVISGDYIVGIPLSILTKIEQGSRTKAEVEAALNKGEYAMYKNNDGTYTLMLKWWDMDDENGPKYDDIPSVQQAGGVGNYLKQTEPDLFGNLKDETIEKINNTYRGKAIQNIFFYLRAEYLSVKERMEIPNTLKVNASPLGSLERKATAVLTPSAGIADAPADPLSIKLLKSDVKTGQNLSEGFKFELQVSDNGTTWNAVGVNNEMIVKGTLNADNTLTPDESGIVEVKRLSGGKKYRFVEKAHPERYEDVQEDTNNPNTLKNPKSSNSRVVEISNQGTGKVVVMYNQQKPEKTEIKVAKKWVGPEKSSVTVKLLADGQDTGKTLELTKAKNWMGSFTDIDKVNANGTEIKYSIEEVKVTGYDSKITGDAKTGFTITNTNNEKISVEGKKTWDDKNDQDGKRPNEITINLLKNGVKVASKKVTAADGWKWNFDNLYKYENGNEVNYSITEEEVEGYTSKVNGYNVVNSRAPEKVNIEGKKIWDDKNDQDGKRPNEITINLLKNGVKVASKKVTAADGWKWNFGSLDKYENGNVIAYTITEERATGYTTEVNEYNVKNIYTPGKTSIQVTKAWDDNNDKDKKRPASVTIKLLADGKETGDKLVLTKENGWTGSFKDIYEYKNGKKIAYTVKEESVGDHYKSVITGNEREGFVVTNVRNSSVPGKRTPDTGDSGKKTPNTGDLRNAPLYTGLLGLAGTILLIMLRKKVKNKAC